MIVFKVYHHHVSKLERKSSVRIKRKDRKCWNYNKSKMSRKKLPYYTFFIPIFSISFSFQCRKTIYNLLQSNFQLFSWFFKPKSKKENISTTIINSVNFALGLKKIQYHQKNFQKCQGLTRRFAVDWNHQLTILYHRRKILTFTS